MRNMGQTEFNAKLGDWVDDKNQPIPNTACFERSELRSDGADMLNKLLAEHNLELVEYDTGGDFSMLSLIKKV